MQVKIIRMETCKSPNTSLHREVLDIFAGSVNHAVRLLGCMGPSQISGGCGAFLASKKGDRAL
jgi:hypothetical protein